MEFFPILRSSDIRSCRNEEREKCTQMEDHTYHVNMAGVRREIMFPFQVAAIGRSQSNPPRKFLRAVYPDKIEICIRLAADESDGSAVQLIGENRYENLSYPHVVVKPPKTEYTLSNFGTREVFYMIYPSSLLPLLEQTGIFDPPLCWNIRISRELEIMIERVSEYSAVSLSHGNADRIDIQCFQILHELLLMKKNSRIPADKELELMLRVDSWLRLHAFEAVDFSAVAKKFGFSRSSFFRYWKRYSEFTPSEYLLELRLQEAARRLTESRDHVADIGRELKLGGPAYMGMLFKKRFGQTPLDYRRTHAPRLK